MRNRSTQRALGSMLLVFESVIVFFATLTAFGLDVADARIVWAIGLTLSLLMILTPGLLGKPGGYIFGSILQILMLASGFWVWGMFFIGAIFAGMWIWAMVAGFTIDRARKNYLDNQEATEEEK